MKHKRLLFGLIFIAITTFMLSSCKKEETRPTFPLSVQIFQSVVDKQVAFTALTHSAVTWTWDFGDGKSSNEQNPVHIYENGGYYKVTLTGTDASGKTASTDVNIAVALTPYVLLTGGPTNTKGKTWKLSGSHSGKDLFANADANFSVVVGPLPSGVFGSLGMVEVYDDTYTFHFGGSYSHDTKADGAAFGGLVNQYLTTGGAGVVNSKGKDYGLCTAKYTPQAGATFTYVEKEDFKVASVYGPGGVLTYNNVSTLDFSGTEFIGFWDHQRKVIVQEITDNSMRLVMFMSASPDYFPLNTHALILTFEVVK
ncbi:MAG: PKD domain-containing protein [Bacteroidota bacterium]|nr:PKD domain-containing protein [Bacteroidota bacterium]